MSYCRWSSDDWKSEVYCYESGSGWVTHVAGNKVVGEVPKLDHSSPEAWEATHRSQMDYLETAERKAIGLPHDGETFTDYTLEDFRDRLLALKQVGYRVPDWVFKDIDDEIEEERTP